MKPRLAFRQAAWHIGRQIKRGGTGEDKTSLVIEEVNPSEAITAERVGAVHRECLATLEAEQGADFWRLR